VRPVLENAAAVEAGAKDLMAVYENLPDRVYDSDEWRKLRPEITCQQEDGSGYGGCWHARVTAIMGEAARTGGVFTQEFPKFSASVNSMANSGAGIAADARVVADKIIRPKGFWGNFKDLVGLGVRAGGALGSAGLLDVKVAGGNQ
jgi:hypothetical protein